MDHADRVEVIGLLVEVNASRTLGQIATGLSRDLEDALAHVAELEKRPDGLELARLVNSMMEKYHGEPPEEGAGLFGSTDLSDDESVALWRAARAILAKAEG